jgi:hypothetical protein
MIINGEDFFEAYIGVRDCFITGRKGSGKTLLAFAMAQYALEHKFIKGVLANIPHKLPKRDTVKDSFVIIDESWQLIDNRFSKADYSFMGAWSRKTNTLWAFPSVFGVDLRVRNLQVERIADISLLPVRCWLYKWENCWGDKGHFLMVRPEQYFGVYDTHAIPINDGGAIDSLMSLLPPGIQLVQKKGRVSSRESQNVVPVVSLDDYHALVERVRELESLVEQLRAFYINPESSNRLNAN